MAAMVVLALIGATLLALSLALVGRTTASDLTASPSDIPRDRAVALILLALVIRLALQMIVCRNGLTLCSMDEPIRWSIAYNWSLYPFAFTFWDGIWLTGHSAFWGSLLKLPASPTIILQAGVIFCAMLTIGAASFLTYVLSGRRSLAAIAALLISVGYPFIWLGSGLLAEPLIAGSFMLGLAFSWRFCQESTKDHPSPAHLWCNALGASLFIFATTTLHYIGWMAVAVGVPFFLWVIWTRCRKLPASGWLASGLMLIAAATFPIFWILASWHYLGHPLQFLINQKNMNLTGNFAVPPDLWSKLLVYPRNLSSQTGLLFPLLIAIVACRRQSPVSHRAKVLAAYILLLFGLMILSGLGGGHALSFFRSTIILYSLLLCFFTLCLFPMWHVMADHTSTIFRGLMGIGFVLMLLGWMGFNGLMGNRYETYMSEKMPHDVIALGSWLQQEARSPQTLQPFSPATRIGVYAQHFQNGWVNYYQYASGCPERIVGISNEEWRQNRLAAYQYLFLLAAQPPAGWLPIGQIGDWTICRAMN